jgi:heme/copper-type cytochrome/quinol oxidase subunit 1
LGLAAILLLLFSFFSGGTLDIHIHDTYYIIAQAQLFVSIAILLLLFSFIYKITSKNLLSKSLSWLHTWFTLLFAALLVFSVFKANSFERTDYSTWSSFVQFQTENRFVVLLFLFGTIAQLLLIINLVGGILKTGARKQGY